MSCTVFSIKFEMNNFLELTKDLMFLITNTKDPSMQTGMMQFMQEIPSRQ